MPNQQVIETTGVSLSKLKWKILDVFYPPFCCACGCVGYELCPDCTAKIVLTSSLFFCQICEDQIDQPGICSECSKNPPYFSQLRSWGVYSGVLKEAIRKFKFHRGLGIVNCLIDPVVNFIRSWGIHPELILPVPLSVRRFRDRGYNQSELIAKPIADILNIRYSTACIQRIRDTHSQVGLNAEERKNNIANAFVADKEICGGRIILLVDDIATTGATLNECAAALKKAGAADVFCFTLARAVEKFDTPENKVV